MAKVCGQKALYVAGFRSHGKKSEQNQFLQVVKGCGKKAAFEDYYRSRGKFDPESDCFVSHIRNTTNVTSEYFGGGPTGKKSNSTLLEQLIAKPESLVVTSQVQ
jgi:hypothetical protein